MTNITERGGYRFVKGEGINMFPSIAVVASKLFCKDPSEGKTAGITDKIIVGDDVIFDKYQDDFIAAIAKRRDEIMINVTPFHDDTTTNPYLSVLKITNENGNYYKIYSDHIEFGASISNTTTIINYASVNGMFNFSDIKQIFKRANDYMICTNSAIFIIVNGVYKVVYQDDVNNEYIYIKNRIIIAMNGGIRFSKQIASLDEIVDGYDFDWNRAEYRYNTIIVPASGNTPESSYIVDNGLDKSDNYTYIFGKDNNIYAFSLATLYTINIDTLVNNYDSYVNIPLSKDAVTYSNNNKSYCEDGTCYIATSRGALSTTDITYSGTSADCGLKYNGVYISCKGNVITVKTPTGVSIHFTRSGLTGSDYKYMVAYKKDGVDIISLIGSKTGTAYNSTDNTGFIIYPAHYIHDTDYSKETQVVKMYKYNIVEFCLALYDKSSTCWNNILYIDGQATNFVYFKIVKPGNTNNIWFFCGEDHRGESEYKDACSEFGIE